MAATALGHAYVPATDTAPGTVTLDVRHLDTDSYTRSVDRAAMAWARRVGVRNYPRYAWTLTGADYGNGLPVPGTAPNGRPWCVSAYTFTLTR